MASRGAVPKVLWGAGFTNVLNFPLPLDGALAYEDPREGSEWAQSQAGVEDAWVVGTDQLLMGTVRHIPAANGTGAYGAAVTGWDGAAGWRAFLNWARLKNVFRFYPDATQGTYLPCYLVDPLKEGVEPDDDYTRRLPLRIRTSDGSVFTGY